MLVQSFILGLVALISTAAANTALSEVNSKKHIAVEFVRAGQKRTARYQVNAFSRK